MESEKNRCDWCNHETGSKSFIFYEVAHQDRKHRFGIFCLQCTIELLDLLKGKLEWFHTENGWRGYIRPEARSKLERANLIHSNHNTQSIEIDLDGRKSKKVGRTEILEILSEISRKTE